MLYRHYGIKQEEFDVNRLIPAKTQPHLYKVAEYGLNDFNFPYTASFISKPISGTGFWASRVGCDFGWADWCKQESFNKEKLKNFTDFRICKEARVYEVDSLQDIEYLVKNYSYKNAGFIFEEMKKDYDAIEIMAMNNETYYGLYGWDCESILILNPEIIRIGE